MSRSWPLSAELARARLAPDASALPRAPAGSTLAPAAGVRSGPDACGLTGPATWPETASPAAGAPGSARKVYLGPEVAMVVNATW